MAIWIEKSANDKYPYAVVYNRIGTVTGSFTQKQPVFAIFADIEIAKKIVDIETKNRRFTRECFELAIDFGKLPHDSKNFYRMARRSMPPPKMPSWITRDDD
jgi:hypothetical protein